MKADASKEVSLPVFEYQRSREEVEAELRIIESEMSKRAQQLLGPDGPYQLLAGIQRGLTWMMGNDHAHSSSSSYISGPPSARRQVQEQ